MATLIRYFLLFLFLCLAGTKAGAHSVGQVQTTKYFAPETVQMLTDRLQSGGAPGFVAGDTITYIIQFTPIGNGATTGVAGYITDYLPPGVEVVGADIVQPDGNGGFVAVAPQLPGGIDTGTGRTANTFAAPFNTAAYDPTGRCSTAGLTNNCNGRLTEVYADTGIFFSTDPRTAMFPGLPTRIAQGTNGYNINPTGAAGLNTLLGQATATTHNLWDAQQTNAFGTSTLPGTSPNANSSQGIISSSGRGAAPYYAGSAVAGPQTGYPLDNTASVGPWQRIYYPGSRMGDASTGPTTLIESNLTAVGGFPTSTGWNLSPSNPLPSNTNAVRWAVGKLVVGTLSYVRIKLRLTSTPPASGIVNSSEVFGGDAGDGDDGKDMSWRYHVPSVADNNSNLFVLKKVIATCSAASLAAAKTCTPTAVTNDGAIIPASFVKLRYQITYLNSGNSTQTNVQLSDVLPYTAGLVTTFSAGNVYVKSGADIRSASTGTVLSNNGAGVGGARIDVTPTDITNTSQQTAVFQTIPSLPGGSGGVVELDVVVADTDSSALDADTAIKNIAKLASTAVPGGITSVANSSVTNTASLVATKSVNVSSAAPGGTVTYTITIQNVGNAAASSIVVRDFLPFTGTTADATRRFNFVTGSSAFSGFTSVTPTTSVPPTVLPYSANANQQQVTWTLTGQTLAAGATATISFNATVGANVPSSVTPYTNDVIASYNNGSTTADASATNQAPVTVTVPLTVTKTLDCVYTAGTCNPYTSGPIPSNAKVRYKIDYANTSGTAQTNVYICDQLTSTQSSPVFAVSAIAKASTGTPSVSDSPALGALSAVGSPNAACGFSSSTNAFSYAVIPSLAANSSGTAYVDVTTNAANSSTLTNTAKVVSTEYPGGASSSVSHSVYNNANLVVSKTTSTPTIAAGGTATYTITVTNTGNQNADAIEVYDFLPYVGTTADATRRFNFNTGSSTYGGSVPGSPTAPTITAVAPPTQPSHSGNTNQQQVKWAFPIAGTLAPGASFTITFTATAGSNLVPGSTVYTNDVEVKYKSGTSTLYSGINNTAPVTIPSNLTISKTIDCVFNLAGTACNAYNGSGLIPTNAKIRYRINYANTSASAQSVYVCDQLPTQIASFASVTTPSIAPTPAGPYTDSPSLGARTSPANAACGFTGGTTFSYPLYNLPANSSGNVYFDVQTNATTGANVTNTGKIVNSVTGANETSSVSAVAIDVPNLLVSKTTSTPNRAPGETATYTISITNNGNAATTSLKVNDFLPYSGSVNDATKRFAYVSTTGYTGGLPAPTITTSRPPTVSPYNSNTNQQQVTWDFGSYALAAGATVTITFTATVGSNMPNLSYYNTACADFDSTGGAGTACATSALVTVSSFVPPSFTFLKTVATISDPVNGTTNPKNIPGAIVEYSLIVTNSGGAADSNTIFIRDAIPANTAMYVNSLATPDGPIAFSQGTTSSGLTYTFGPGGSYAAKLASTTDDVDFSDVLVGEAATDWDYIPTPGTDGCDPLVKRVRINPKGVFVADTATPDPSFTAKFRVCVQ